MIATSGEITSENYPNNYPNNVDKKYFLNAPTGHKITFNFIFFDIEVGKQRYILDRYLHGIGPLVVAMSVLMYLFPPPLRPLIGPQMT